MNKVDEKYFEIVNKILQEGNIKKTRAGETISIFSQHMEFDLKDGFPILTTKKVFTRGFIHELLWFLKGKTNIKYLLENNVHIWDDDAYRYYCELIEKNNQFTKEVFPTDKPSQQITLLKKIPKEEFLENVLNNKQEKIIVSKNPKKIINFFIYNYGDLGPVYGKQWRSYGKSCKDQIQNIINTLKNNPDDRRMICWAFNQDEINDMALPPCHMGFEVYSRLLSKEEKEEYKKINNIQNEDEIPQRELSLCWMQRSCDFPLGFVGNLMSYSLLLSMLAQVTNMTVGKVSCWLGDVHIYINQLDGIKEQLCNNPHKYDLPKLILNKDIKNIDDFTINDIQLINYESYPKIKFPLSVG